MQRAVGSPPLEVFPTEEAARLAIQSMRAYGGGSLNWHDCLYGMTHLEELSELPEAVAILWGDEGYPETSRRMGLWTWLHNAFLQGREVDGEYRADVDIVLRMEHGLARQLAELTGEDVERIELVNPRNTAPSTQERPPLDTEALDWIYMADDNVMSRQFGYQMSRGPLEQPPDGT